MINAIVTGACSGIGFQTALALAQNEEIFVIAIARNRDKLLELKKLSPKNINIIQFDLENKSFELIVNQIIENINSFSTNNKINILINNAGILTNRTFLNQTEEDWAKQFDLNFFSNLRLIKSLYPYFEKSKDIGSHIVNIGSMGGIQGAAKFSGLSIYSASKSAINSITESLAVEFLDDNIHVNSINPGSVMTEMFKKAFPKNSAEISALQMGKYIADFSVNSAKLFNGRIIEVSLFS